MECPHCGKTIPPGSLRDIVRKLRRGTVLICRVQTDSGMVVVTIDDEQAVASIPHGMWVDWTYARR